MKLLKEATACPYHGLEYIHYINMGIGGSIRYCYKCSIAYTDSYRMSYDDYLRTYPEFKPKYELARVTLDEADKKK